MGHYEIVLDKLEKFIRKYYLNNIIRGTLILLACIFIIILLLFIVEINLYLPASIKIVLIALISLTAIIALIRLVIVPILGLYNINRNLDIATASTIIGDHFPTVQDKLLNVIQLKQQFHQTEDLELIQASIDQKATQLSIVPFTTAINVKKNRKFLPYAIIPLLLLIVFWLLSPNAFNSASERLLQPTIDFAKPAPFQFIIKNKSLEVPINSNVELEMYLQGDKLPQQVYCVIDGEKIEMQAVDVANFKVMLNNISKHTKFHFEGGGYQSEIYTLNILEQPIIENIQVQISYPAYIGKATETHQALSDWSLPEGTVVNWNVVTKYTDKVQFIFQDSNIVAIQKEGNAWKHQKQFLENTAYTIDFFNQQNVISQQLGYHVTVIKDQNPTIQIKAIADKTLGNQLLFVGTASDDNGLNKISFVYQIEQGKTIHKRTVVAMPITGKLVSNVEYYFDAGSIAITPGQTLKYYFEAWDNDGINGSKVSRSEIYTYSLPIDKDLEIAFEKNNQAINSGLNQSESQNKQLQNDMAALQKDLLQSKQMSWQQQQQIEELAKKQAALLQQMEQVRKRFEEQQKQAERKNLAPELQEKQEALKQQLDHVVDQELKKQLDKLKDLLQQKNPEQAFQQLQQIQQENKLSNMNIERIQELIAQLEMQMKLESLAKNLENLAKEEMNLMHKTNDVQSESKALNEEQKAIQKDFKEMMNKDFSELKKELSERNKEGNALNELESLEKESENAMKESSESLQQGNKSAASKAQQKATNKMQKMAQKMQQMAGGMDMEQLDIDIKATRQILSNLIRYSFDQEQLIKNVQGTTVSSPSYIAYSKEQGRLRQNAKMIKDSLFVLSKRVFQVAATVNKETSELEYNLQLATNAMEQRIVQEILVRQQRAMTNANNLALLLNELLENLMDAQAAGMQDGSDGQEGEKGQAGAQGKSGQKGKNGQMGDGNSGGSGNKGQGGQKMKDIITKQQQLGGSMQQKAQQSGGSQSGGGAGQGTQGNEGSDGGEYGNAKELAQFAKEQALLRKQIQELSSYLNSTGVNGVSKDVKAIQELMNKNETDLVNKRLSSEFINRQQEILQRMLQTEKAIREQEEDNKRVGQTAEEKARPMPPELKEYLEKHKTLLDQYKTIPPTLQPYYKKLSDDYLQKVN